MGHGGAGGRPGGAEAVAARYRYPSVLAGEMGPGTAARGAGLLEGMGTRATGNEDTRENNMDSGCKQRMNTTSHHCHVNQGNFRTCYLPVDRNLL